MTLPDREVFLSEPGIHPNKKPDGTNRQVFSYEEKLKKGKIANEPIGGQQNDVLIRHGVLERNDVGIACRTVNDVLNLTLIRTAFVQLTGKRVIRSV